MSMILPGPGVRTTLRGRGEEAIALQRAADVLAYARHPGVPELLDVRSDATATELDIALPESTPLGSLALTVDEVAGVTATVATTVADLHDIGVVVGAVAIGSIVVSREGQAVLTDFTRAARLEGPAGRYSGHPLARRDDQDVGLLLCELLDRCTPSAAIELLDAPRWSRRSSRHIGQTATARRLAARAAAGAITSRGLAERLAADLPGARLPRRQAGTARHAGAAGAAAPTHAARAAEHPTATAEVPADAFDRWFEGAPASPPRTRRWGPTAWVLAAAGIPALVVLIALTHRPSGASPIICSTTNLACARYRDGILTSDGSRYTIGATGDVVAVGTWWCGAASAALLRPSTGQVWLYRTWPSATLPATPQLGATVPGARGLAVQRRRHCDELLITGPDGHRTRVTTPS
jgi:hypothetical protein